MPVEFLKLPTMTVHADADDGSVEVEFNFDPDAPRPWTPFVNLSVCSCASHLREEELAAVIADARTRLRKAEQADAIARIAAGEETVREPELLRMLGVGTTKLGELRHAGLVPEPVTDAASRNVWLKADIVLAHAAILAAQATRKFNGTVRRKAPLNPHAQRRLRGERS